VKENLLPRLARIFYRRANAIIAVSQGVADDLVNNIGVSRNKTHVIYNPIVTPALLEKMQIVPSHPWFVPGTPPVVLAVGRLTAQKDYPALLHAFALARQEREMHLLILGEGEKRFELEAMVSSLGLENDVQMPGFVPNPYMYMARASVFVLSSAWEGFSNVIAEALACGVPVVSTDCPSGPAEILENGKFGKLVPVGDPNAMARAILATLDSIPDRRLLRQRAQVFSLETVTSQYIDLFESLLGACECR
jgi:glycosyltransferase involved in cell wall biosynthesis